MELELRGYVKEVAALCSDHYTQIQYVHPRVEYKKCYFLVLHAPNIVNPRKDYNGRLVYVCVFVYYHKICFMPHLYIENKGSL